MHTIITITRTKPKDLLTPFINIVIAEFFLDVRYIPSI